MRRIRPLAYLLVAATLLALGLYGAPAWATPEQAPAGQGTVPTARPPATAKPPTPIVTVAPPASSNPPVVPATDAPATPQPQATSGPAATDTPANPASSPSASATLGLALTTERALGWPGADLPFSAVVDNRGTAGLSQVTLDIYLAEGLAPGSAVAGAAGTWSGRTLHVEIGSLAPGEALAVPFDVIVLETVRPGVVLQVMGVARAAGEDPAVVQVLIPLPPAQLPVTGARGG